LNRYWLNGLPAGVRYSLNRYRVLVRSGKMTGRTIIGLLGSGQLVTWMRLILLR
jgi:hypothetical protein